MFFCEACKERKKWPGFIPSSWGPCEICGKTGPCYDVQSKLLP